MKNDYFSRRSVGKCKAAVKHDIFEFSAQFQLLRRLPNEMDHKFSLTSLPGSSKEENLIVGYS
jgi:hypothetical protein